MLDAALKTQLQAYLEKAVRPIVIVASVDDGAASREMLELLEDIKSTSDKISLEIRHDAAERTPSFALSSPGQDIHLRFAGLPMGHEFTSLVLALLQVGGHPVKEDEDVIASVRDLEGDLEFVTYQRPFELVDFPDVVGGTHYVVLADYVNTEDGSGLVHQAPAFGEEDMAVCRAYGLPMVNPIRPDGSFEADLEFTGITDLPEAAPLRGVFIRAPWVEQVGPEVSVLARVPEGATPDGRADGRIVAVAQGAVVATSFHPEVTGDLRVHQFFVDRVRH